MVGVRTADDVENDDLVAFLIDPVPDPIGAAARRPAPSKRGTQRMADPLRVFAKWAVNKLPHTSIRQYQRPNGEMIALLVITPSKTNRERVIPMSAELFHMIAMIVLRQTAHGPIPLVSRYDGHERVWTAPMPYLFQRQIGGVRRVTSTGTILNNLRRRCQILGETNPAFRGLHFTPHDFRRLFATDLVNNGLPIHIGAALLGHVNLQTTQGYVAVFEEDVIRHTQDFLARRRAMRPQEEYRPVTDQEWEEFEEHFDKRKVELGSCGRPYGTSCQHEHACLRCPQLHVNPKMLPRLEELEADLEERRKRASVEGWLGEIEGIDRTLQCLRDKRTDALRLTRITHQVNLGMPTLPQRDNPTPIRLESLPTPRRAGRDPAHPDP